MSFIYPTISGYRYLSYRGNYSLTLGTDFAGTYLSADFGGGYGVRESIFPSVLYAKLTYSALSSRVNLYDDEGNPIDRLTYIWNCYVHSQSNGKLPFVMRVPRPLKEKLYLWEFTDDSLELTLVDSFLATTGLGVRQVRVQGVQTNTDGSLYFPTNG